MSNRRDVRLAIKALVAASVATARVHGFDQPAQKPTRADPGGDVFGHPDVMDVLDTELSPLTYHVELVLPIELSPPQGLSGPDADAWLDAQMMALGTAVRNEATGGRLGQIVDWLDVRPAEIEDLNPVGAVSLRWAGIAIVANYPTHELLN